MTRRGEKAVGIALLVLTACGVGSVFVYARVLMGDDVARDARYCPVEAAVKRWTLVAVDWTDRFTGGQRDEVKAAVDRLAEAMGQDEGLSLHVITGKAQEAAEAWRGFAYCKPRDPRHVNALTETASFVRKDYEKTFGGPLAKALGDLLKGGEAGQSPILEALEVAMWSPRFKGAAERRLVVFSDLLHHTPSLSHLKGAMAAPCAVAGSDIGKRLGARMAGVKVVLHYRMNADYWRRQGEDHLRWWSRLLYQLGAASVHDGERLLPKIGNDCMARAVRKGAGR